MAAFKAHYDGHVIVPDEAVDLAPGQGLLVHTEPLVPDSRTLSGVPGRSLLSFAGVIDADDLRKMSQAIDKALR
jgi:hypothetical protein